jgi:hypothetical protein
MLLKKHIRTSHVLRPKSISNGIVKFFIQNDSSKLTLPTLINEFLYLFYIRLVIFLFI